MGTIDVVMNSIDKLDGKLQGKFNDFELKQREFADELMQLKQSKGRPVLETKATNNIGSKVVEQFNNNKELFEKTKSVRFEIKAATDPVTTASGRNVISLGIGGAVGSVLGIQNGLPSRLVPGTTAIEYSRNTGVQQGAAAVQASEGDAKAAVRPTHSLITQTGLTVAGYTKMSRQSLSDSNELSAAIETTLFRSVSIALDTALVTGATGFTGGLAGLAVAVTTTATKLVDAVSEVVATMQLNGFEPDIVALHPNDWQIITTAKGTSNDHYLSGTYLGALTLALRGLRVILSPSIAAGKALVMDSRHTELVVSDAFTIEVAFSGDDFTRNLATVLGETRVIPVFRSVGSAILVTPGV